jgi:hypothetical protein
MLLLHSMANQADLLEINGFPRFQSGIDIIEDLVVSNNPNRPSR